MDVRLLVIAGCPHASLAAQLLRTALDGLGPVDVSTTVVSTEAEAEQLGFPGSPTILIDGTDPFAEPGATPGLACRVYRHPGGASGLPDAATLRRALERAAAS